MVAEQVEGVRDRAPLAGAVVGRVVRRGLCALDADLQDVAVVVVLRPNGRGAAGGELAPLSGCRTAIFAWWWQGVPQTLGPVQAVDQPLDRIYVRIPEAYRWRRKQSIVGSTRGRKSPGSEGDRCTLWMFPWGTRGVTSDTTRDAPILCQTAVSHCS